ncbi:hypothetical protein D3C77_105990 [compost metagenome]
MISVFADKFSKAAVETYYLDEPVHLLRWLETLAGRPIDPLQPQPISVSINGRTLKSYEWLGAELRPTDDVRVSVEPKGFVAVAVISAVVVGAWALSSKLLAPKLAGQGTSAPQGDALDEASATGNKVKANDVIPENAGLCRRFPDYLVPPRREFRGPRAQWVELLLCVGRGEYDIDLNKVKIGDTPAISLGEDVEISFFPPGADLSTESAAEWWHPCEEVGTSSSGSAGLELTVGTGLTNSASISSALFDSDEITVAPAAGAFPSDWSSGLILRIVGNYPYTVVSGGGAGGRDVISGDITQLGLLAGDLVELAGSTSANNGNFIVHSATATDLQLSNADGSPASSFTAGPMSATIGPRGLRYRVLSFSTANILIERLTSAGSIDTSWPGFSSRTITSPIISLDPSSLVGGYRGPMAACPEDEKVTELSFSVFFPGGLYGFGREGQIYAINAVVDFEYRDMAVAGAWTVVTQSMTNSSVDAVGYTFRVPLPYAMRPECRMKRRPTTIERANEANDKSQWYSLYGKMARGKTSYEGVTVMVAKIRGGDRISADSESQVSCEVVRRLPGLDGVVRATRDIAPWLLHICDDIGYARSDIDVDELARLNTIWQAREDRFDYQVLKATTVREALADCLRPGFSELTIDGGQIRPVRNEPRTVFKNMYTAHEMTKGLSTKFTARGPDDPDGVDVEYLDGRTWQKTTVPCRLPGDQGVRAEKLLLEGVLDRDHAYRIGMRQRRAQEYQRREYSWSTEMDGFNSPYLSYDAVSDSVPGFPQSAVLLRATAAPGGGFNLEASENLEWDELTEHLISLRQKDGTVLGPYPCIRVSDRVAFVPALTEVPEIDWDTMPPTVLFGRPYPVLVTKVAPDGTDAARVTAVNYDPRVYLDDDSSAPD